ncbi:hypothetical protein [Sphingomonas glaciei]
MAGQPPSPTLAERLLHASEIDIGEEERLSSPPSPPAPPPAAI